MIKYLSLDLQGTLSDSKFSDNFWMELLPLEYAKKNNVDINNAKTILKNKFKELDKYNILYYDDSYWAKELNFDTVNILNSCEIKPSLNKDFITYIKSINIPKIINSTTTDLFISYELGNEKELFEKIYSCVDYYKTGGKNSDIFKKIAEDLGVNPNEILHIGDNLEMDVENAKKAGVCAILFNGNVNELINELKKYLEV